MIRRNASGRVGSLSRPGLGPNRPRPTRRLARVRSSRTSSPNFMNCWNYCSYIWHYIANTEFFAYYDSIFSRKRNAPLAKWIIASAFYSTTARETRKLGKGSRKSRVRPSHGAHSIFLTFWVIAKVSKHEKVACEPCGVRARTARRPARRRKDEFRIAANAADHGEDSYSQT